MLGIVGLINAIITNYLLNSNCVTILTDDSSSLYDLMTGKYVPFIHLQGNTSETLLKVLDLGCSDFFIQYKNPSTFLDDLEENIHITNQRNGRRKLVFLPTDNESSPILESLLSHVLLEYIPDVIIVLPKTENIFEIATHKYATNTNHSEMVILDKWFLENETFEFGNDLFVDKIAHLNGRKLRAATFSYTPYSILELNENNEIIGLDGTEMRTALEFCTWLNCTLEIIRDDEHEWGEIWDNRSGNGILGNIAMDNADIGYGALYTWYHEYKFLDLSMPIVRTGITCIAPAPELLPSWYLPILPFRGVLWGTVFVTSIVVAFAVFLTSQISPKPLTKIESYLITIGMMVMQVPYFKNTSSSLRQVVNWMMFFTLMLSNIYSSGLASSITVPMYNNPIDTVQELVDSGFDWGATHDAWIFSILEATQPNLVYLVDKFKKYPEKLLKSRSMTRDFAFSVERLPAGHFAIGKYIMEDAVPYLRLMQDDIYWEQCLMMARKSSPYTDKFNTLLGRLHQSGLIYAWETQVILEHANFAVQLGVRLSLGRKGGLNEEGPRPLTFKHLQGPLFLWTLGMATAIFILIIEIIYGRNKKKNKNIGKASTRYFDISLSKHLD